MYYALVLLQAVTPLWLVMNTPLFKDQKKQNNNNNEIKQNKEEKKGKKLKESIRFLSFIWKVSSKMEK